MSPVARLFQPTDYTAIEILSTSIGDRELLGTFSRVRLVDFAELLLIPRGDIDMPSGETALVPGGQFPDDLDTTSLALQVLQPPSSEVAWLLLRKMAEYVNEDGNFQAGYYSYIPAKANHQA